MCCSVYLSFDVVLRAYPLGRANRTGVSCMEVMPIELVLDYVLLDWCTCTFTSSYRMYLILCTNFLSANCILHTVPDCLVCECMSNECRRAKYLCCRQDLRKCGLLCPSKTAFCLAECPSAAVGVALLLMLQTSLAVYAAGQSQIPITVCDTVSRVRLPGLTWPPLAVSTLEVPREVLGSVRHVALCKFAWCEMLSH